MPNYLQYSFENCFKTEAHVLGLFHKEWYSLESQAPKVPSFLLVFFFKLLIRTFQQILSIRISQLICTATGTSLPIG